MSNQWTERWQVEGTTDIWTVSRREDGSWGCSCPAWKFQKTNGGPREDCHHIRQVKGRTAEIDTAEVLAAIAGSDAGTRHNILCNAYRQAGYLLNGHVSDPMEDFEKQHYEELRHRKDLSVVLLCGKGVHRGIDARRPNEIWIKKLF